MLWVSRAAAASSSKAKLVEGTLRSPKAFRETQRSKPNDVFFTPKTSKCQKLLGIFGPQTYKSIKSD